MAKLEPYVPGYYLWSYMPSIAAAAIFLVLFLGATGIHFFKLFRSRAWFNIPLAIGGIFEFIGFIAKIISHFHTAELGPYSMQSLLILLAPVLFAASVYMTLGRIIRSVDAEQYSMISLCWLTRVFVTSDILAFLIQGNGAGLQAVESMQTLSKVIVIVGLIFQVGMFVFFIVVSVVFHMRMQKRPTSGAQSPWKYHMHTLFAVSGLILVRSIYRVVEYVMGYNGYLLTHEWPLYVFDCALMWLVMVIWAARYPGDIQTGKPEMELLATRSDDGMTV
ncbi:RTA1 domain-containing protein [Aspergillus vadensis CBS 113365]|uniref:RTA1 domain protein n=1 Tax=Aspergillus vadensis (strain CBS 113365 / IMI 142717 / IBT 24658) TaxID=1448311 RepID=A0A319BUE0_ASPVC|nr:RTA1 domain protein [Aspergillus vadensis CBS 113365]PYH74920.1 RTA1 domain protein [Aspergillus vadensis CBS 113365]